MAIKVKCTQTRTQNRNFRLKAKDHVEIFARRTLSYKMAHSYTATDQIHTCNADTSVKFCLHYYTIMNLRIQALHSI